MGKVLIFGGTFDPPHKGHRHLLKSALRQEHFDRVLLIPAYIPPHKDHTPALSFEMRCGVLKDFFSDIEGLEILPIEQERGGKSFTIDTVETLQAQFPNDELYLLIGTDMFLSFETWRRYEDLLKSVVLIVGSREKGDREKLEGFADYLNGKYRCKGIVLCSMKPVVCSSSELRALGKGLAERALNHINIELDVKRARHTLQVADYAKKLAPNVGVDPEKAYLAGLMHDCTKCYSTDWHLQYAKEKGILLTEDDLASPQVLHQITGAVFAEQELGCSDQEILTAIACHTTGKPQMLPLEMLLLFADSCEPTRTYSGVERLREAGENDLKKGTLMLLTELIVSLKERKVPLHPKTSEAKESLLKELEKNG